MNHGLRSTAIVLTSLALVAGCPGFAQADDAIVQARRVLTQAPIIDGHNDLPWVIREKFGGSIDDYLAASSQYDTDIPRLRSGMVGTQFWSVYVPTSMSPTDAVRTQLEQIDLARRIIEKFPDDLVVATSVADIASAHQQGRIASLLGMEGGHTIASSLGALRSYYNLGVRYLTLTHFHSTDWADSATGEARHDGLSSFGQEVILEMNRLGMMIDLSHTSVETMSDVLSITESPVIFSHSSARALTDHVRNIPDRVLRKIRVNGGVVMVTFIPEFVQEERRIWADGLIPLLADVQSDSEWKDVVRDYRDEHGKPPLATLSDVADHIDHVAKVAGVDHVGIGGDFYGAQGDDLVLGLEDVSRYPFLIAELVRRGWSDEDLRQLARENILRVFAEVEKSSERLQRFNADLSRNESALVP